jgi:addiction module RelE/StbE family toxin
MVRIFFKIIWSKEAKEQLKEIYQHIKQESEQGAKTVKEAIFKSTELLITNPQMYEVDQYKIANDGSYRAYIVFNYRISYKITEENKVNILRIRHTSREPRGY